jgi:hypothetical protein
MLQETQDGDELAVERIAALDIGKAEVACWPLGSRRQREEHASVLAVVQPRRLRLGGGAGVRR